MVQSCRSWKSQIILRKLYLDALGRMAATFVVLAEKAGSPVRRSMGDGFVYRYSDKSIHQAIVQKLARTVTSVQAISFLNSIGLLQEQAALQRTLDEFHEDIVFLCFGVIYQEIGDLHASYLSAFWEEEFDDPGNPIASTQRRPMPSRRKIRAYLSRDRGTGYDPSSSIEVSRTLSKTYSGYVHGASPQLMELYYGNPPSFHLAGCTDSPHFDDHAADLLNYYYRTVLSFAFAAKAFGEEELFEGLCSYSVTFARASGQESNLRE